MVLNLVYFAVGLILVGMVLNDVFETVVVPGGSKTTLRVAHRLTFVLLPLWKRVRGQRRGLSGTFAPFILVTCFVIWIVLLSTAFGLMAFGLRSHFDPPLNSLPTAIYMVGSSVVTIGVSEENALGIGRWLVLSAGFCGLAVMTMAVTYLLEVQGSVSRRDTGIIKLNTSAGQPPSALTLLERFASIRNRQALRNVLEESRTWCATVRQSHSSHPSLIYFQSVGTGSGWPAALGAVLDLALISEHLIEDDELYGPAVLLREEGARMAKELAATIGVMPQEAPTSAAELQQVAGRLSGSGYPIRNPANLEAMAKQRTDHMSCVNALADHLGKPTAMLIRQS